MARDLFTDVVEPSIRIGTRPWYSVPLSIVSHLTVLGVLVVAPLMATRGLPAAVSIDVTFMPDVEIPAPPPLPTPTQPHVASPQMTSIANTPSIPILEAALPESFNASGLALPRSTLPGAGGGGTLSFGEPSVALSPVPQPQTDRVLPVGGAVRPP